MTILEAENQNLRRRMRELELEFRSLQETHARVLKENEQLKGRIEALERHLQPGSDGRFDKRVDATFRVDGLNSRGEAAMGVARNVSAGGAFIEDRPPLARRRAHDDHVRIAWTPFQAPGRGRAYHGSGLWRAILR